MINKTLPTELGYVPQRKGEVLYVEKQEDLQQDLSPYRVIKFKRGIDIVFDMALKSDTDYVAFGDPADPKPILRKSSPTTFHENVKVNGVTLADLDIRGGQRGLSFYSCRDVFIIRCHFSDNTLQTGSHGVYAKYTAGIKMIQCTAVNVYGDVFYGTGVQDVLIEYCDFGSVDGGLADSIQVSHEGKDRQLNSDVIIRNNILRTSSSSTSGKGAIAIEGTDGYTVLNNDVEGQYFGMGLSGKNGYVAYNTVHSTDKTNRFSHGIGVTKDAWDILIEHNTVKNASRGIVISAANPAGTNVREDIVVRNNTVKGCTTGFFADVAYTGVVFDNDFGRRESDFVETFR